MQLITRKSWVKPRKRASSLSWTTSYQLRFESYFQLQSLRRHDPMASRCSSQKPYPNNSLSDWSWGLWNQGWNWNSIAVLQNYWPYSTRFKARRFEKGWGICSPHERSVLELHTGRPQTPDEVPSLWDFTAWWWHNYASHLSILGSGGFQLCHPT